MPYTFTPPSREQRHGSRLALWSRFGTQVSDSIVKKGGRFTTTPWPTSDEIEGLIEGIDWFLGGHVYSIPDAIAAALVSDGFPVEESPTISGLYPGGFPGLHPSPGGTSGPGVTFYALRPLTPPGPNTFPTE